MTKERRIYANIRTRPSPPKPPAKRISEQILLPEQDRRTCRGVFIFRASQTAWRDGYRIFCLVLLPEIL